MGIITLKRCDCCNLPLEEGSQKLNKYNGLCIEIGYSIGGWGDRRNFIKKSMELCIPCYDKLTPHIASLDDAISKIKKVNG